MGRAHAGFPKKGGIGQIFESNAYLRAAGFAVKSPSQKPINTKGNRKMRKLRDIEVSAIGMGCMGFTHGYGRLRPRANP